MEISQYQWIFSTLWVTWFFILFTAILVWVLRPSRRRAMNDAAQIPFREQD